MRFSCCSDIFYSRELISGVNSYSTIIMLSYESDMQIDRIRYVLSSYTRTRIEKVGFYFKS